MKNELGAQTLTLLVSSLPVSSLGRYRGDQFFDIVMDRLIEKENDLRMTHIPQTNVSASVSSSPPPAMMSKKELKKAVKRAKKERKKQEKRARENEKENEKGEEEELTNLDVSAITDAASTGTAEPAPARRLTVRINEVPTVEHPAVLTHQAHSHDSEFQKLHGQKKEQQDRKALRMIDELIPAKAMELSVHHVAAAGEGGGVSPKSQQQTAKRLSKPLKKNTFVKPPPPHPFDSNLLGRQRPHPEAEPEGLTEARRSEAEIETWVKKQDIVARRREATIKAKQDALEEEVLARVFSTSDASEAMLSHRQSTSEGGDGGSGILEKLYKDGLKIMSKKKKEPASPYPHSPTAHLQNKVTKDILDNLPRRKDSFMSDKPAPPPPQEFSYSPSIPEESKRMVSNDRNYDYKKRENARVANWIKKSVSFHEEHKEISKMKMQECVHIFDSPRRKSKEAILAAQEVALSKEQTSLL
jgi:hypothetical protein